MHSSKEIMSSKSISRIYTMVSRFISRFALFFIISVFLALTGSVLIRISELRTQIDAWGENFENSLFFMDENGFFTIGDDFSTRGINSFVFDNSGDVISSNIAGLEGVNISPNALFLAAKDLGEGEIYIGLHPDFFTGEQYVFLIVRHDGLNVCLRYPVERFFPARVAGTDVVTIVRNSRIIYSNVSEWIGAAYKFRPVNIIRSRIYLAGRLDIAQMQFSKIIFYKNVTAIFLLIISLLLICVITLTGLYHASKRFLSDLQTLREEQVFITDIAGALSDNLNSVMNSSSEYDAYDNVLKKQALVLEDINTGFIENQTILKLFSRFTVSSRRLLRQLNEEAENRAGIQKKLISSQEKALAEKDVLISEIHHRVKNNLQIIAAILNISGAEAEDSRFRDLIESVVGRIHAIAFVHEILYSNQDENRVPAEAFLRSITSDKFSGAERRQVLLDVSADDIHLGLDELVPLGLIFNELISNSMRHDPATKEESSIAISIKRCGEGMASVVYCDNDSTLFSGLQNDDGGVGLLLIRELVNQLGGRLDISQSGGNVAFSFEFPLSFAG